MSLSILVSFFIFCLFVNGFEWGTFQIQSWNFALNCLNATRCFSVLLSICVVNIYLSLFDYFFFKRLFIKSIWQNITDRYDFVFTSISIIGKMFNFFFNSYFTLMLHAFICIRCRTANYFLFYYYLNRNWKKKQQQLQHNDVETKLKMHSYFYQRK